MKNVSLRWQLLFLFCLLGLLPLMAISYFSIDALTHSLEQTYDNQVSQLVRQAAAQTSTNSRYLINDLENEVQQPYLQLSFQQYPQNTRIQLLQERLELFLTSRKVYTRLNLCNLNGGRLVSISNKEDADRHYLTFEKDVISGSNYKVEQTLMQIHPGGEELVLFIPVYSFRYSTRIVGFMVAYLPLDTLTTYLEKLVLGQFVEKKILTSTGEIVKVFNIQPELRSSAAIRKYEADIESMNWRIEVNINEDELFRDVNALNRKSTLFIAIIIVFAFLVSFIFSHRFTKPFGKIISGTRTFAAGDLTHRIQIGSGREAKQLATAFNDMACQLHDRQMELNQAVRLAALGVMTAGIGHEIKNPLTGIKTSSQVINRIISSDRFQSVHNEQFNEIDELAQGISEEADRLTKILNDLLELGKPRKPEIVSVDLADTVNHVVGILRPKFNKKQVSVKTQVFALKVLADRDQILQVLLNLLLNSLEAVDSYTGEISILSETIPDGSVILKIIDNGVGIAEDKLQHIFDPFFSLRKDGTGLGLSIVYTLLKQNNASIKMASKINEGTVFEIDFAPATISEKEDIND